jgi:iron(III) transport system permease protein
MLGVGAGALVLGVSTAWLVTACRFPGHRLFRWTLLLPLAMPAYVIAYVYTDLLEYAGPFQQALRAAAGWERAGEYWFPPIRSLGGAVAMMSLVLYPYVYLLARSAFAEQSVAALDVARTLGCGAWGVFFRVALPAARPAIAAGLALVLMETLNDLGTVDFFGVQTLTAGIYDVWLNMGNLGGAAQIATVMLAFVVALIAAERMSRARQRHFSAGGRVRQMPEHQLRGWRAALACALCGGAVALGFAVPATVLLGYSVRYFDASWTPDFQAFVLNSLALALGAALITVAIALVLGYSRRLRQGRMLRLAVRLASMGYAVPGAVLAVGIIVPLAGFDNALDAWMRETVGISTGLLLSGSVFALVFAYVVRFLAVSLGSIESSLGKITPAMDMASRSLGHGPTATFARVHLPLVRSGMLAGGVLVFVDCMKELPATLILRPFDFETLATHVYQFASEQRIEVAALGALAIVLAGLGPVILLSRAMGRPAGVRRFSSPRFAFGGSSP